MQMKLRTNRHSNVLELIERHDLGDLLNAEIPVNIERVAVHAGAQAVRAVSIPAAGMLKPLEEGFEILVNSSLHVTRQRFSCAHEIAHALIDPDSKVALRRSQIPTGDLLEKRCESLAALLLMPDPSFTEYALARPSASIQSIVSLANRFATSIQATAIRYIDVVKHPCVLTISKPGVETGEGLRVAWSHNNLATEDGPHLFLKGRSLRLLTADLAYRTNVVQADVENVKVGELRVRASTESKAFGRGANRYVMTLIFPESTN